MAEAVALRAVGYDRGARGIGVRDHLLVVPSVGCTNRTVELLALRRPEVRTVTHQHGCGQLGGDLRVTASVLARLTANPNVRGAVIVGLGCESNVPARLGRLAEDLGADVRVVVLQEAGGIDATLDRLEGLLDELAGRAVGRPPVAWSDLRVGVLADHAAGERGSAVATALADGLREVGARVLAAHSRGDQPTASPAGATTVPVTWGRRTDLRTVRDLPLDVASDVEQVSVFAAEGAQLVVHVTGRANPIGSPVAPTIKLVTNPALATALPDVCDVDASGRHDLDAVVARTVEALADAAAGAATNAERAGQNDFGIPRLAPSM